MLSCRFRGLVNRLRARIDARTRPAIRPARRRARRLWPGAAGRRALTGYRGIASGRRRGPTFGGAAAFFLVGATARRLRRPVTDQAGVGGTAPRARACPGRLSARTGFGPKSALRRRIAGERAVPWSLHGCIAPRRHSPNRRRSAAPGPRPVAPHAVPGGPGHLRAFTFRCRGGAYLRRWPPPRSTFGPREPARRRRLLRVGDDRLVARVRAGDDDAFEIIYDRYYRGLLAFCGQMLGSRQEAEDALQHSFASAYRALRGGAGDIDLRPWLYTIARNRCLSALRAQRARGRRRRDRGRRRGRSRAWRRRSSSAPTCATWWTSCSACPTTSARRWSSSSSATSPTSRSRPCSACAARRSRRSSSRRARRCCARATAREAPCVEIREQLATLAGRVPRRSIAAQPHRPLPRLRGVRARGAPSARGARGDPAPGADRRPEGLGAGLRARRRRRGRSGRRRRGRRRDGRRGRRAGGRGRGRRRGRRHGRARPPPGRSAPPARRRWPPAWPPAGVAAWRACRPRASSRRSWPWWRWAAAARRRRSTPRAPDAARRGRASPPRRPPRLAGGPVRTRRPRRRPAAAAAPPAAASRAAPSASSAPNPTRRRRRRRRTPSRAAAPAATPTPTTDAAGRRRTRRRPPRRPPTDPAASDAPAAAPAPDAATPAQQRRRTRPRRRRPRTPLADDAARDDGRDRRRDARRRARRPTRRRGQLASSAAPAADVRRRSPVGDRRRTRPD